MPLIVPFWGRAERRSFRTPVYGELRYAVRLLIRFADRQEKAALSVLKNVNPIHISRHLHRDAEVVAGVTVGG
jgi:hypothetical protein